MSFGFGSIGHQADVARADQGASTALALPNAAAIAGKTIASNSPTAPASHVAGANAPQTSTELSSIIEQNRISLETLRNANTEFGYLNRFINTSG